MSTVVCPHCNTPNAASARFCAKCGNLLSGGVSAASGSIAACPRCHVPLRSTARFCPNCGYNIAQMPGMPPAGAPPPPQGGPPSPGDVPPGTRLLGETDGGRDLLVRWMGGRSENFSISKPTTTVGRAPDNDVVLNHPAVSGHHLS
jgi:hypothetical protein